MENYEYDKVFLPDSQDDDEPDEREEMANLLHRYERELKDNPKFVLPFAHAVFEWLGSIIPAGFPKIMRYLFALLRLFVLLLLFVLC